MQRWRMKGKLSFHQPEHNLPVVAQLVPVVPEDVWTHLRVPDRGTDWRPVVSFKPRPLYTRGNRTSSTIRRETVKVE
jgi:hypothetical protein